MKHTLCTLLLLACAPFALCGVTGLYDTGVDDGGSLLAVGAADPHYNLVGYPDGAGATAIAIAPHPAWVAAGDGCQWIGVGLDAYDQIPDPEGVYAYELYFTISDDIDLDQVTLSGSWATDNGGRILLNGQDTGIAKGTDGYAALEAFSITDGLAYENILRFEITNASGGSRNPTGLLVCDLGATVVPAPGAIVLGSLGMGVVGWLRRRRSL